MKKLLNDQVREIPPIAFSRHCRDCQQIVLFSDQVVGVAGARIPLNKDGTRHSCKTIRLIDSSRQNPAQAVREEKA